MHLTCDSCAAYRLTVRYLCIEAEEPKAPA